MFDDLYDAASMLLSWRWPKAAAEVTAVSVERITDSHEHDTLRLAVAYKFSVGDDGPYTGESFWQPMYFSKKRMLAARRQVRVHQQLPVRYRADDPQRQQSGSQFLAEVVAARSA
jgi:hypothetical protein